MTLEKDKNSRCNSIGSEKMKKKSNNLDLFLRYSEKAVFQEDDRRELADKKASMFMGVNSVVLGVLYFSLQNYDKVPEQDHGITIAIITSASLFTLSSLILCMYVLIPLKFTVVPNSRKLYQKYYHATDFEVQEQLIAVFTEAFEENSKKNNERFTLLFAASVLTLFSTVSIFFGVVLLTMKLNG
jgi:hypothetical protein